MDRTRQQRQAEALGVDRAEDPMGCPQRSLGKGGPPGKEHRCVPTGTCQRAGVNKNTTYISSPHLVSQREPVSSQPLLCW